eukprot:5247543-Alexandrium_andersonii.AAC.1
MAAIPEEATLWHDLDKSPVEVMDSWYTVAPPLWCCRTSQPMVSTLPDKVERTVKLFESLMLGVSSMGERQAIGTQDSIPTRLFRIAGLFQEFGCSSLVAKQCL